MWSLFFIMWHLYVNGTWQGLLLRTKIKRHTMCVCVGYMTRLVGKSKHQKDGTCLYNEIKLPALSILGSIADTNGRDYPTDNNTCRIT